MWRYGWVVGCVGCAAGGIASPVPWVEAPDSVEVLDVPWSEDLAIAIPVQNRGTSGASVSVEVTDPFIAPESALEIDPGSTVDLVLVLLPTEYTTYAGTAVVSAGASESEISLTVTVDPDLDDDSHVAQAAGGDDCDDTNPFVRPGATELCNGSDDDCNGVVDDAANPPLWFRDADEDGSGDVSDSVSSCDPPPGYVGTLDDCDDDDATAYPGASETWYDGIDQDCSSGSDYDQDLDGCDASPWGDDCDDRDPDVHSAASEIWYDGTDQDCDGDSDFDADGDGHDATPWGNDCDDLASWLSPSAPEFDNFIDDDCDQLVDEGFAAYGDVIVTELLIDPDAVPASDGQFVELYNVSHRHFLLDDLEVSVGAGTAALVGGTLGPGETAVLCVNAKWWENGDLPCTAKLPGKLADNDGIALAFAPTGLVVDEVDWSSFPSPSGASLELAGAKQDADDNDIAGSWCVATASWPSGDLATPGDAAASCP